MKLLNSLYSWGKNSGLELNVPVIQSLPSPEILINGKKYICFSSNNYLGLATDYRLKESAKLAVDKYGIGTCESRNLAGNLDLLIRAEHIISKFKGYEDTIIYATGYLANVGTISALTQSEIICRVYGFTSLDRRECIMFVDEASHISIFEGVRLSGARCVVYKHVDIDDLENKLKKHKGKRLFILTDGVFSQDGDIAPLPSIVQLAKNYDATVYVDDAHATGILGKNGRGTTEYYGLKNDEIQIVMGTLSKAIGAMGGFVSTQKNVTKLLRYTSYTYGFTSSIPPEQTAAIIKAFEIIKSEPERRNKLWENTKYFQNKLIELGFTLISKETPIIPVMIGDEERCKRFADMLFTEGIFVTPIIFPAVKMGKSRLRFQINTTHTYEHMDFALNKIEKIGKMLKII